MFSLREKSMRESLKNKPSLSSTVGGSYLPTRLPIPRLRSLLDSISSYKALVVGDGIIDEYVYVKPLGKSPKENIISNRILDSESFRGGVWAAAAHIRSFVGDANLHLFSGVHAIRKRRFVETGYIRKLFETHQEEDQETPQEAPPDPLGFDLCVVTDFGHGCLTHSLIERLTASKTFLAVNAQTNSANHGFNLITK